MEFLFDWNVKNLKNDIEFHFKLLAMTKYVFWNEIIRSYLNFF